jgi:hypothetical protein
MSWLLLILIILLVSVLILVFVWWISLRRKRAMEPSHIQLYFDENFRKIINEWDFVTRDRIKDFKKDMNTRLTLVGSDIDHLEKNRSRLDKRFVALDREMARLEGL